MDLMSVKLKFNTSKRRKGVRTKPDLSIEDLESLKTSPCNRRVLLSICNGIYVPLGIAVPFSIKLKIPMKDMLVCGEPTDWDKPVTAGLSEQCY